MINFSGIDIKVTPELPNRNTGSQNTVEWHPQYARRKWM